MTGLLSVDPTPMECGYATLAALADLLEQEYLAFKRADGAAASAIAATKRRLTETLVGLDRQNVPAGGDVESADDAHQNQVADLARRCRDLNRRNGQLLALQQSMLTRALRVLLGTEQSPALYSASGESRQPLGSRHIASV